MTTPPPPPPPPPSISPDEDPPKVVSYAQKLLANLTVSHSDISADYSRRKATTIPTPPKKSTNFGDRQKPSTNSGRRQAQQDGYHSRAPRPRSTVSRRSAVVPRPRFGYRPQLALAPFMGYTENGSATYISSGNPCLDFFFQVVPDTPSESLIKWLRAAWAFDPLTTLKLVCNLRGVRGTGKTDKEGFFTAAFWLFKNHPETLASNVASYPNFGCFKDLPELLFRLLHGYKVRQIRKQKWTQTKARNMAAKIRRRKFAQRKRTSRRLSTDQKEEKIVMEKLKKLGLQHPRDLSIQKANAKSNAEKEKARALKEEKKHKLANELIHRYTADNNFRFLYDEISLHFARCLKSDMEFLKSGELNKISLAAKWCPSLDSSYDRSTLLCESIARNFFPIESNPEYEGIEDAHYAYRIRDRLRKEVLVPLRKVLELPEVYIGANQWGSIKYNRVASVAMSFYTEKFIEHDEERFKQYLDNVKSGKEKITAGALLPHEIISPFLSSMSPFMYHGEVEDSSSSTGKEVAELQWMRMVQDLLKKGKLDNCIAVCDVSGSMSGMPMLVCVALGMLVSELSKKPWKGKVITFSANPQLQMIEGDDLESKAKFVESMDWGMNTNFQRVFDLILDVAKKGNLRAEQMVKTVFVFSDMEFDQASANPWETDYQAILRKFAAAGYGSVVPEIVFWNLRNSRSVPVSGTQSGVALLSGHSKNLIKAFLNNDNGVLSPVSIMMQIISGEEYQKLFVVY